MPGFNKLVRLPFPAIREAPGSLWLKFTPSALSANKLTLWKTTNLRALISRCTSTQKNSGFIFLPNLCLKLCQYGWYCSPLRFYHFLRILHLFINCKTISSFDRSSKIGVFDSAPKVTQNPDFPGFLVKEMIVLRSNLALLRQEIFCE